MSLLVTCVGTVKLGADLAESEFVAILVIIQVLFLSLIITAGSVCVLLVYSHFKVSRININYYAVHYTSSIQQENFEAWRDWLHFVFLHLTFNLSTLFVVGVADLRHSRFFGLGLYSNLPEKELP